MLSKSMEVVFTCPQPEDVFIVKIVRHIGKPCFSFFYYMVWYLQILRTLLLHFLKIQVYILVLESAAYSH